MENSKTGAFAGEPGLKQRIINSSATFGPKDISQIAKEISRDQAKFNELRETVSDLSAKTDSLSPAEMIKYGICQFLVGDFDGAAETLARPDVKSASSLSPFYLGKIALQKQDCQAAVAAFNEAQKAGYSEGECALGRAQAYREAGQPSESQRELDNVQGDTQHTAEYAYQYGATCAAMGDDPDQMLRWYERAHEQDRNHPGALFGLALECERHGDDEQALEYYQRLACLIPTHVGALINLGVLYEDRENYEDAVKCFRRVLEADPTNVRAKMFFDDAAAAVNRGSQSDRASSARSGRSKTVYDKSVFDYELSTRARNALKALDINTVGDLCSRTPRDLLAAKNFGDSSLDEVRKILDDEGLQFGSLLHESGEPAESVEMSDSADDGLLSLSIEELNLNVRAKKCLSRKDIRTIGELVKTSAEELLNSKNFGVTSLNEIRKRLAEKNLKLKGE